MALRFRCPCGKKLKAEDEALGMSGRCPKCGRRLKIPRSTAYEVVAEVTKPVSHEVPSGAPSADQPERVAPASPE